MQLRNGGEEQVGPVPAKLGQFRGLRPCGGRCRNADTPAGGDVACRVADVEGFRRGEAEFLQYRPDALRLHRAVGRTGFDGVEVFRDSIAFERYPAAAGSLAGHEGDGGAPFL